MLRASASLSSNADPPPILPLVAHPVRWHLLSELVRSDRSVRELTELVGELSVRSDRFRQLWARHDVRPRRGRWVGSNPNVSRAGGQWAGGAALDD